MSPWIEAMRLRTLPVSVAGVVMGTAFAIWAGAFNPWPAAICLVFAVLAQIASNFANEYYDYKDGLDKPGREGPRRGVTEGDITPRAMKYATFLVLALACAAGCSLIYWGGWWLIAVGAAIAVGVLAYSAGPFPLSRHALGEVAVVFFFGIIPVNFTFYLQSGAFDLTVAISSVSLGLMGANVLLINNYRDYLDDRSVGKVTIAVKFGQRKASTLYLFNGYIAVGMMAYVWLALAPAWRLVPIVYLLAHTALWMSMISRQGAKLNPLLGGTAVLMFLYSIGLLLAVV